MLDPFESRQTSYLPTQVSNNFGSCALGFTGVRSVVTRHLYSNAFGITGLRRTQCVWRSVSSQYVKGRENIKIDLRRANDAELRAREAKLREDLEDTIGEVPLSL